MKKLRLRKFQEFFAVLLSALITISPMGCGGSSDSGSGGGGGGGVTYSDPGTATVSSDDKVNVKSYNSAIKGLADNMQETMSGIYEAVGKVSADYTKVISTSGMTQDEMDAYTDTIAAYMDDAAKAMLYNHDALVLGQSIEAGKSKGGGSLGMIVKDANDGGTSDGDDLSYEPESRRPLFFIAAGLGLLAYGAYKGVAGAIGKRTEPAKEAIDKTSEGSDQHKQINSALGLKPEASKTETKQAFENLGLNSKLSKAKEIEAIDRDPDTGQLTVQDKIPQAIKETSVELGKTAVTTTVGAATTVTGGQGIDKLAQAAGLSSKAAATVDLAVSAANAQPLDILANSLTVNANSNTTTPVTIPKSQSSMTVDQAKDLMKNVSGKGLDSVKNPQDLIDAANVLASDMAKMYPDQFKPVTNADGSTTVQMPDKTHIMNVDNPVNNQTLKIPDLGLSDVLISLQNYVPELIKNLNLSSSPNVGIEHVEADKMDSGTVQVPSEGNYNLLVVASPADPGPNQGVTVTATINPATAGVTVSYSVSGTDGYGDSGSPLTDSSGKISFYIPGGAANVRDTVTVSVQGGISKTFSYSF